MPSMTSEAAYTEKTLADFDTFVWDFNSPFHWRIFALDIQALYDTCLAKSLRHCEVAVGTGLFLKGLQATESKCSSSLAHVTLVDLNPNSLKLCQNRLLTEIDYYSKNNVKMELVVQDILNLHFSSSLLIRKSYDSVAANFLLHCLHKHDNRVKPR
jgi:ubiquinone/menaquinone biosynthesis C-methylase UbiE